MNEKITIEDIHRLTSFGTQVRVLNSCTGKLIIDDLNTLARSNDKRQAAKWEAYKDVVVNALHPGTVLQRERFFADTVRLTIEATIHSYDDELARKRVMGILSKKEESK